MDQYWSRPKLSENFEGHWSIPFLGEIHMDQSLVHTFSWGNLYGPMVLKVLQKFPPTMALVHGWLFPALARLTIRYSLKFSLVSLAYGGKAVCFCKSTFIQARKSKHQKMTELIPRNAPKEQLFCRVGYAESWGYSNDP